MPPLKSRGNDISLLANSFLIEFADENGLPHKPLSERAAATLLRYSWPGNVRELRTTIEHGVVMSNESTIRLNHLPSRIQVNETIHRTVPSEREQKTSSPLPTQISNESSSPIVQETFNLAEIERQTILRALEKTQGNRTEAAILLGISRRTLHRKLNSIHSS